MTRKKKFKKVLIIIVVLSPLWLWLWFHPIQKSLAEMRFESYIAEQNVPEDDIATKEIMRDAKRDVYEITVTYKSDPKNIYVYTYSPPYSMRCTPQLPDGNVVFLMRDVVYPPLEDHRPPN